MITRSVRALGLSRGFSAQPAVDVVNHQIFRTQESNPNNHAENHIGRFYNVPKDVCKTLFTFGGLPMSFTEQTKTFTETCIMVRRPALEIMNYVKHSDLGKPVNRYVIYGTRGTGKSLTLAHLLHYASTNNFLLFHVPWVPEWLRRVIFKKEVTNSSTREGFVDLPIDAAAWLIHFKKQNQTYLKENELRISNEYVWSKREKSEVGSPLQELIELGINRYKFASDIFVAVAREIKTLSKKNVCKTFVAVDGFNAFFNQTTHLRTPTKRVVQPDEVTLTTGVLDLVKNDWSNGVVVLTVDGLASNGELKDAFYPRHLLGKEGFEEVDPFIPIEVKDYTDKEFSSCIAYYRDRLWFRGDPEVEPQLAFTSGKNPYYLMKLCAPL